MIGTKEKQADQENLWKGKFYDKIPDPKVCVYQIHPHYVQLHFRQYGVWHYDGKCGV